jgi:hypothetical protein
MRIFIVIAAAAGLVLSVAVAYAHEPPKWTSEVKDGGGRPAWVDDVKTDGGPPAFVETAGGRADEDNEVDEDVATDGKTNEGAMGAESANVPEWVEAVKANGGPPAWVAEVRTTPTAAKAAAQKKAGR